MSKSHSKTTKIVLFAVAGVIFGILLWFLIGRGSGSGVITIQIQGDSDLVVRNLATEEAALPVTEKTELSTIAAAAGELLQVQGDGVHLYYPFRANERRPLDFRRSDFRMYLNDQLVGLDLSSRAAWHWLANANKDDLETVCTISLGGHLDGRLAALKSLPSALTCVLPWETLPEVRDVLVKLSPHGLVLLGNRGRNGEPAEPVGLTLLSKFSKLRILSLIGCDFSGDLSPLEELTELEYLTIQGCRSAADIQPIVKMPKLRVLNIAGCPLVKDVSPTAHLSNLQTVDLRGCDGIENLTPLTQRALVAFKAPSQISSEQLSQLLQASPDLKSLSVEACENMKEYQWLVHATQLTSLVLPVTITDDQLAEALSHPPKLRFLNLAGTREITNLAPLGVLSELVELDISGCDKLTDVSALAQCEKLRSLSMAACRSVDDLSDVGKLSQLERLNLATCENVGDLSPLAGLTGLRRLTLGTNYGSGVGGLRLGTNDEEEFPPCERFESLQPLESLTQLRRLDVLSCPNLTDVSALKSLTHLKRLSLNRCFRLRDVSALSSLQQLEKLQLVHGENAIDLSPLAELKNLKQLDAGAPSFSSEKDQDRDLSQLAKLTQLEGLSLTCCEGISDLSPLASLQNLRELDLFGCRSIDSLTPLEDLPKLQYVNLAACDKIKRKHRQALRDAIPLAEVLPELPPAPPEPPSRQLSPEEEQLRRDHMDEVLALIPARFSNASVSFTREGGQDVSDVTATSDRIRGAMGKLNSKGCAEGLIPAARHVAFKPDIVKFFILELGDSRPEFAAIRQRIGEPDRTETVQQKLRDETGFGFDSDREVEKEVAYHIYDWIQFGEVDDRIRLLRIDCTKLPAARD